MPDMCNARIERSGLLWANGLALHKFQCVGSAAARSAVRYMPLLDAYDLVAESLVDDLDKWIELSKVLLSRRGLLLELC